MDAGRTVRVHEPGQLDDSAETGPLDSETESEAMPALQQPPQPSDVPPRSGGGLQDAHSRFAELLLVAASILEEITRVGGAVAGERGENWRQTAAPATGTVPQVEIGASSATSSGSGGGQAHHVGVGVQPLPATSSPGGGRCREQPAASASDVLRPTEGAAIALYDDAVRDSWQPGMEQTFQQRLPVLTALAAEGAVKGLKLAVAQTIVGRKVPQGSVLAHAAPAPMREPCSLRSGARFFPKMDSQALDSLALEQLLSVDPELGVTLAVTEDDNITSLQVACGMQTHLDLNDRPAGPDADALVGAVTVVSAMQSTYLQVLIVGCAGCDSGRFSPAEKEQVRLAVDEMLAADIAPSNSPWGAPIVLVKKRDGN
ncbi:unnamed protein product [Lampetra fluviatilis]